MSFALSPSLHQPRLNRGCRLREQGDAPPCLLIPEGLIKLSESGLRIVRLCDGEHTIEMIINNLQTQYPEAAADRITSDTLKFIQRLVDKQILSYS